MPSSKPNHLEPIDLDSARAAARQWEAQRVDRGPEAVLAAHAYGPELVDDTAAPVLHLDDVSAIPFISVIPGVERYQHRARVRARTGDVFAAVSPVPDGYEEYCRDRLELGSPSLVMADPIDEPTAVARACRHGAAWTGLCEWARRFPRVVVHPYMAIADVWELARALAVETDTHVNVLGPTLEALWIANDKSSLTEIAQLVAGEESAMRTVRSNDVEALAALMRSFAELRPLVGLKRTRCASAMGNAVFESSWIAELPDVDLVAEVSRFLERTEWDGREEVLVVEWADTDISPSTQMWIPPLGAGDPILDGIFEQLLEGREKVFLGSRPSTLPDAVHRELARASLLISAAFQVFGYVGRCSFDFIVVGDPHGDFDVRITECNGRWGGTSTPMFLVDRLGVRGPDGGRAVYRAQDFVRPELVGATFRDVLGALAGDLYDPKTGAGRFIVYNVGPLEKDGKFDIVSLGRTPDEADEGIADVLPRRLGL